MVEGAEIIWLSSNDMKSLDDKSNYFFGAAAKDIHGFGFLWLPFCNSIILSNGFSND